MIAARQQGSGEQLDLFDEALGRSEARRREERQADTAWQRQRALTRGLMEKIAQFGEPQPSLQAGEGEPRGAEGGRQDRRRPAALDRCQQEPALAKAGEVLITALLDGSYQPQPARGVEIPKPGGGKRQLGIPTVVDRLVQQAIQQVLEPLLDSNFSASSFGFRPGRGRMTRCTEPGNTWPAATTSSSISKSFSTGSITT